MQARSISMNWKQAQRTEKNVDLLPSQKWSVSKVSPYRSRNRLKVGCFRRSGPINFSWPPAKRSDRFDIALRLERDRLQAQVRVLFLLLSESQPGSSREPTISLTPSRKRM